MIDRKKLEKFIWEAIFFREGNVRVFAPSKAREAGGGQVFVDPSAVRGVVRGLVAQQQGRMPKLKRQPADPRVDPGSGPGWR